jgi:uncharacterized protein
MESIYIPSLVNRLEQTEEIKFSEFFPHIETLTPVKGQLKVTHHGDYLQVKIKADTIITLTCDRCLQQYNHRLLINTEELIWLRRVDQPEVDVLVEDGQEDDLWESLPPDAHFDTSQWIYEQLSLALPPKQLCNEDCAGITLENPDLSEAITDQRWSALEILKKQLSS